MQRKHLMIGALIALPLLVGGGAAAFAASGSTTGTSPAAAFISDLASHLGISTSTLQSAMQQTELDQVQKMVQSGKLSQTQASKIEAQIKAGKVGPGFGMGMGMRGHRGGPMMMDGRQAMQAAATYLGVTQQQLQTDLQGGKTLSAIASSTSGKTVQGLEAAITTALKSDLQQAVTNGKLTQQQEQNAESHLQQFVQQFVTHTGGPGGHRGGHGWGTPQGGAQGSGSGGQNAPTTPTN